jgi:transcriptional regulator with XRE-family HTH domain
MGYADILKVRIFGRRKELGISQRELARRAGLSHVTINSLEQGLIENPSSSSLRAIAKALDLDDVGLLFAATASEERWPLHTSRGQIEALSERDRSLLNSVVATFVTECKRLDGKQ